MLFSLLLHEEEEEGHGVTTKPSNSEDCWNIELFNAHFNKKITLKAALNAWNKVCG